MDKLQAEELLTSTYELLINKIRNQEQYDPNEIINSLHKLCKTLQVEISEPAELPTNNQNYEFEYKQIAQESLSSYAQTTESIENINQKQQKYIQMSTANDSLHLDDIMSIVHEANSEIQTQMQKSNEAIRALRKQVTLLEKKSNLDPLTHTFNRRSLESYIESICKVKKSVGSTHILLLDIDDFKVVNDTYGHLAGDRVLIFLAKFITNLLREQDKVFRFGGEEFLIVLNRCKGDEYINIGQRIIEEVRLNTLLYKEHQIQITLSIGATSCQENDSFESLIERADKALYKAKHNGKNQLLVG